MRKDTSLSLTHFRYSPGYCDMRGAFHCQELRREQNGDWTITSWDKDVYNEPKVVTKYAVDPIAAADFEAFLIEKKVVSLEKRLKSKVFVTDYSPWNYSFGFEKKSPKGSDISYYSLWQYKVYTPSDVKLLRDISERFSALKGQVISQTTEEEE